MPISTILDPFELEFMQRAALEVALLAPLAGILGTQIVLRGLAFYTHGVGTAAFPGLVVAGPLGIPPALAALAVGIGFGAALEGLGRAARVAYDAATALLLVAALAIGIVLASDVYESGAEVDQLLFGSLLAIGNDELRATAIALAVVVAAAAIWHRRWVAIGFDSESARSLGITVGRAERALLVAIAVAVVVTLDATGALLVGGDLDHAGGDRAASRRPDRPHRAHRRRDRARRGPLRPLARLRARRAAGGDDRRPRRSGVRPLRGSPGRAPRRRAPPGSRGGRA